MASIPETSTKPATGRGNRQLTCDVHQSDPSHVHTDTCYTEIPQQSVIELFQSQGCRSTPVALPNIHKAVTDTNLLLLTYNVTYWNNPDWEDTFSNPDWDQRQRQYLMKWGRTSIFTPQIIVNGVVDGVGARPGEVADVVARARKTGNGMGSSVSIVRDGKAVTITSSSADPDMFGIFVVSYDTNSHDTEILDGANKGRNLTHRNVVTGIEKIGQLEGGECKVELPEQVQEGIERVLLVQGNEGGAIVAAMKIEKEAKA